MSVSWNFEGKLILVTGSTKGIGRAISELYLKSGASVIIHSRKQQDIDECIEQMSQKFNILSNNNNNNNNKNENENKKNNSSGNSNGDEEKKSNQDHREVNNNNNNKSSSQSSSSSSRKIYGFAADLTKADEVNKMITYIDKIGHLDILINNAGAFYVKEFFDLTDEDWFSLFDANVMSGVRLTRYFLKQMLSKDQTTGKCKGGNIVFVSSEAGLRGLPQFVHYTSTKAAQLNITRALAELTRGVSNVRVNSLLPGPTWTPGVEEYMKGMAQRQQISVEEAVSNYFKTYEPNSLKQQFLTPEEVAQSCLFLTSDAASAINGSSQKAEGGIIFHI